MFKTKEDVIALLKTYPQLKKKIMDIRAVRPSSRRLTSVREDACISFCSSGQVFSSK